MEKNYLSDDYGILDNNSISKKNLEKLIEILKSIRYGSVTLVVQDGIVIQMERNEKLRLK